MYLRLVAVARVELFQLQQALFIRVVAALAVFNNPQSI
jgi:hypothetical protein